MNESSDTFNVIRKFLNEYNLPINFNSNSPSVRAYRAISSTKDYTKKLYNNFHSPKFPSETNLPVNIGSVNCHIILGESTGLVYKNPYIVMKTTCETRADDIINHALNLLKNKKSHENFCLKVKNKTEYIDSFSYLWGSESIRNDLRNNKQITVEMIKQPKRSIIFFNESVPLEIAYGDSISEMDKNCILKDSDFLLENYVEHDLIKSGYLPFEKIEFPFHVQLLNLSLIQTENNTVKLFKNTYIGVKSFLFYGDTIIEQTIKESEFKLFQGKNLEWSNYNGYKQNKSININNLPRSTKLATIVKKEDTNGQETIAWAITNLIDECGRFITGKKTLCLWNANTDQQKDIKDNNWIFMATTNDNSNYKINNMEYIIKVTLFFDEFLLPIFAPNIIRYSNIKKIGPKKKKRASSKISTGCLNINESDKQKKIVQNLFNREMLHYTHDEQEILWFEKENMVNDPSKLRIFLKCVNWLNPYKVKEGRIFIEKWAKSNYRRDALSLLDFSVHDIPVRKMAVDILKLMPDEELRLYLLQLVQIIKYEPYHNSDVSRFLIKRAIQSPLSVGHYFYWHLMAEMSNPHFSERFYLILEEFLYKAGIYSLELIKQTEVVSHLKKEANTIIDLEQSNEYKQTELLEIYQANLVKLNNTFFRKLPESYFRMILNPKLESKNLLVEKCIYMNSKKKPLWLVFNSHENKDIKNLVIFKSGDDLRQDILTLQLLKIMDQIWLQDGLDLKIIPYNCIATGEGEGMIEVVLSSETVSKIHIKYGGGAVGALKIHTINDFLRDQNPEKKSYEHAQHNFVASCAGYCVATYALGIGDRHNSNIMVTTSGNLFHIDFGHFLGNFKSKYGYKRERTPFVFTPEMAYVMGGKHYQTHPLYEKFRMLCQKAFLILRKNHRLFIDLFRLMIPAGMPELLKEEDIMYFIERLLLNQSEDQAKKIFTKSIKEALNATSRQIDNLIHNIKHSVG